MNSTNLHLVCWIGDPEDTFEVLPKLTSMYIKEPKGEYDWDCEVREE